MQNYENLRVWRAAHSFACALYRATEDFPADERYELRRQLRRAAVSIPANIAEGCARGTDRDFAHFLRIATGSANEVDYYLLLARDLGIFHANETAELRSLLHPIRRMLIRLIERIMPE